MPYSFDVICRLQKFTCNLLVCRVVILCIVLVLVHILFNTSGSIPVLNLYIITNTHCLYVTPQRQMSNKSGFEILRESTSRSEMMMLPMFRFVQKRNVQHLI